MNVLADLLVTDPTLSRKDKAWQLHNLLLKTLEEFDPGPNSPPLSHEWRLYRLLSLHYVDGLDADAVSDRLGISRRHYYREHRRAMEAVASLLWERRASAAAATAEVGDVAAVDRLELLRREAARASHTSRRGRLDEIVQRTLHLLEPRLNQRGVRVQAAVPPDIPLLRIDQNLVRQLLLATLGYLVERLEQARISLAAQLAGDRVKITIQAEPAALAGVERELDWQERQAGLAELASLGEAQVRVQRAGGQLAGFEIDLPANPPPTILVVDDNLDMLELYTRHLVAHKYRVITAASATQALALANRWRPDVIILDLMMPGQDGWDLLQSLLSQAETQTIPIVICSVLKQRELALSLGASVFLEKPVTEHSLVSTVQSLVIEK